LPDFSVSSYGPVAPAKDIATEYWVKELWKKGGSTEIKDESSGIGIPYTIYYKISIDILNIKENCNILLKVYREI